MMDYNTSSTFSNNKFLDSEISMHYNKIFKVSSFHNFTVNVTTSTKYYYCITSLPLCVNEFKVYLYIAQPVVDKSNSINVTIVGVLGNNKDRNDNSTTKTVTALVESVNNTDFFLHLGDFFYGDNPEVLPFQSSEVL